MIIYMEVGKRKHKNEKFLLCLRTKKMEFKLNLEEKDEHILLRLDLGNNILETIIPNDKDDNHIALIIYKLSLKALQDNLRKVLKKQLAELGYTVGVGRPKQTTFSRVVSEATREKDRNRARNRYQEKNKILEKFQLQPVAPSLSSVAVSK